MSAASASPSPAAGGKGRGGFPSSLKTPIGGEDVCALVVQLGSCSLRVGYAQEDHPRIYAAAAVGRRRLRLPPKNSAAAFCGSCCCCNSREASAAPPDVATADCSRTSSDQQQQQQQQQQRWRKSLGVSPSVFYSRGPFAWSPEGHSCCKCSCCHPDLLFPVKLDVATPHTEVIPILQITAAAAAAAETGEAKQQQQPVVQLDREAFSSAVRICIEGKVPRHEEKRRTIRPPRRKRQQQQQQLSGETPQVQTGCTCCCAKEQQQQQQQAATGAAACNGRCGGPPDGEDKLTENSSSSSSSSIGVFEAFGCSPFGGLGVWTHEHPLLVVEPTVTPVSLRQTFAAAVFEDLEAPAAFFVPAAAAAAFAMGRSSALVVELGSAGGTVAAVSEGYTLRRSVRSFAVGGAFMDRQIELVLQQQQQEALLPLFAYSHGNSTRVLSSCSSSLLQRRAAELARQIRESCCVVRNYSDASSPLSPQQNSSKGAAAVVTPQADQQQQFELPDGTPVDCSGIRHSIGELLFQPKAALEALQSLQPPAARQNPQELLQGFTGLPNAVSDCVYLNDVDLRRDLLSAVILTGGLALTPGLAERFSDELHSESFRPSNGHSGLKVRVVCPNSETERRSAAWLGGSILASLGTFQELWISKREYEEHGADILEQRTL